MLAFLNALKGKEGIFQNLRKASRGPCAPAHVANARVSSQPPGQEVTGSLFQMPAPPILSILSRAKLESVQGACGAG